MQKEALVEYGPSGTLWRLLCDEGHWLNGTDLAPFPLGYFAAGLAASVMSDVLAEAARRSVRLDAPRLRAEILFTMQGSVLKGTMKAGVDGIRLIVDGGAHADASGIEAIVTAALANHSTVNRALAARLPGRFSIRLNGKALGDDHFAETGLEDEPDPGASLEDLQPAGQQDLSGPIVRKLGDAPSAMNQGAVGLQPEQKRTVRLRADASLRLDGLKEIVVECLQPAGSRFALLSDDAPDAGGADRAPCGLTYLSAGIAFCFMTQLGRYAHIRKLGLHDYRIVQDTMFRRAGSGGPDASPVATLVWLDSDDSAEVNRRMVQMGEQTCYLHTTFRESVPVSFTNDRAR